MLGRELDQVRVPVGRHGGDDRGSQVTVPLARAHGKSDLHLLLVGIVVHRAADFPRWLGGLLLLAGAGYTVDALAAVLAPDRWWAVSSVTFVGEVALAGWLLVRVARDPSRRGVG